jgi:hypothetical protein
MKNYLLIVVAAVLLFGMNSCKKVVQGCMDVVACNYSEDVTEDNGSCVYAETGYDCGGSCVSDTDGDGVCDENEIAGCMDQAAINYNEAATDDDGSCTYFVDAYTGSWVYNESESDCNSMVSLLVSDSPAVEEGAEENKIVFKGFWATGADLEGTIDDYSISFEPVSYDLGLTSVMINVVGSLSASMDKITLHVTASPIPVVLADGIDCNMVYDKQ